MAIGSHLPGQGDGVSPGYSGKPPANAVLRPVGYGNTSEEFSGTPSRLSAIGSVGVSAADFSFSERRPAEWMAGGQDQFLAHDGLGAMRGFALVLGFYVVIGVISLSGLMLWHWLR
ncbi:MAG: hypothetical protein ACP5M4_08045 [Acidobacteriaceae bacterium]